MTALTALCSGIGPPHLMAYGRSLETAVRVALGNAGERAILRRRTPSPTAVQFAIALPIVKSQVKGAFRETYAATCRSNQYKYSATVPKPSSTNPAIHKATNTTGTGSSKKGSYARSILPA